VTQSITQTEMHVSGFSHTYKKIPRKRMIQKAHEITADCPDFTKSLAEYTYLSSMLRTIFVYSSTS